MIDFAESSLHALRWAAAMAAKLNAHVTIVHPYRLNQLEKKENMIKVKKAIDVDAAQNFDRIAKTIFKPSQSYDFRSEVGFIADRVQDFLHKNRVVMLVISKSMVGANREVLDELIQQSDVPLVIVPEATN